MRLTDYYCFSTLEGQKAKMRRVCLLSSHSYDLFEEKRATKPRRETPSRDEIRIGELAVYFGDVHDNIHATSKRRASKSISFKGRNLSSVYLPDLANPTKGFGDVQGTQDGVLFQANADFTKIEIFIGRGLKNSIHLLYSLFLDSDLDEELEQLRAAATTDNPDNTTSGD